MDKYISAYQQAQRKYIWDLATFEPYFGVIGRIVAALVKEVRELEGEKDFDTDPYLSIGIGLFLLPEQNDFFSGYALYISDDKRFGYWKLLRRKKSLYSRFKLLYKVFVGTTTLIDDKASLSLSESTSISRRRKHLEILYHPSVLEVEMPSEQIRKEIDARLKLVSKFEFLANKSLNHHRVVSKRLRYLVLRRDKYTCQACGRRAPEVAVHVDHKIPVSWDLGFRVSNEPEDYQVLCRDCNLGKGDMPWLLAAINSEE